ncbi:hypothetical protein B566_EDAN008778 [Ephemera danica]|nr:hypothetical protein B566_EDAN008778 [Ephemera danica]
MIPLIRETLQTQLMEYCPSIVNSQLTHKFHFVHRLDFITSGVVCIALHRKAAKAAGDSFTNRKARKYYVALVRGWIEGNRLSIQLAIGEDSQELETSKKMCVEMDPRCLRPREAITRLIVLQRGLYDGYPATKILMRPLTGRRHQLRMHLSHIGHTIIGDFTYSQRKDITPPRTFLHSLRLVLPNPIEHLDIKTEDPFSRVPKWKILETIHTFSKSFHLLDDDSDNVSDFFFHQNRGSARSQLAIASDPCGMSEACRHLLDTLCNLNCSGDLLPFLHLQTRSLFSDIFLFKLVFIPMTQVGRDCCFPNQAKLLQKSVLKCAPIQLLSG